MVKISDKAFATIPYLPEGEVDKDNIYALRIDNGKIFFIGWMENAENYAIQMSNSVADSVLDKSKLLDGASMYDCITSNPGYNDMYYAWEKENGSCLCWAEPVCCHDFRVYTCKRASSGGKSPEEAVKSNAVVHGNSFHNALTIHPFPAKVNRPSHLFSKNRTGPSVKPVVLK